MSRPGANWISDQAAVSLQYQRAAFGLCGDFGLRWVSYAQFWSYARRACGVLADAGINPCDRILICGPNSPEWVACLMGALMRGVVVVPLDADSSAVMVARIAAECSAKLILHGREFDPSFLGLPSFRLETVSEALEPNHDVSVALQAEQAAAILYTSGTTSEPRGVVLTHGNIQAQLARFTSWRPLIRLVPFRMLVIAPLSHVQGLILGAFLPLWLGLSIVFVRSVHPGNVLRVIRDYRITLLSTVPRVLQVLTQCMAARPSGIRGLTISEWLEQERYGWMRRHVLFTRLNAILGLRFWVILVGGAALPRYDEQFWRDTGRFVVQGYGLTETTGIVALNGPLSRSVGSIGKPLGNVSLTIAEDGEILVRGATVTQGYFSADSMDVSKNEYLRTGDLARFEKGRLYFLGRKKETIVTGEGFNVYPGDVEAILLRISGVRDAVVLPRSVESGDEVHAVLLLESGNDPAGIVASANQKLSAYQRIRSWTLWPEQDFPRSSLMKVRRDLLLKALGKMESRGASSNAPELSIEAIAAEADPARRVRLLAQLLLESPVEAFGNGPTQHLSDLGLSSLDTVTLVTELERRQGRWLDRAVLPPNPTIADASHLAHDAQAPVSNRHLPTRQPAWAASPLGTALRQFGRPLVVGYWSLFCASITARWACHPREFPSQFVLAAAPHRHWLDAIAICSVLPPRLARRLLIITNRDFREFFDPSPSIKRAERLKVGFAYYVGMALTFPYTIVPEQGSTREGLFETARLIDRGLCPLSFPKGFAFEEEFSTRHDPGPALLAAECNLPIIPVWITGNGGLDLRPRVRRKQLTLAFGTPIPSIPLLPHSETMRLVEEQWQQMRRAE